MKVSGVDGDGKEFAADLDWTDVTPATLLDRARELVTAMEPWATDVFCSVDDYLEAGCGGEKVKMAFPKPQAGSVESFGRFVHPDDVDQIADEFRRNTHFAMLTPDRTFTRGRAAAVRRVDRG